MAEQSIQHVFRCKTGDQLVTHVRSQGHTAWLQKAGEEGRTLVFGDLESNKFFEHEEFQELMDIIRKARKAQKDDERAQRRAEQQTRWPGLGRIQKEPGPKPTESVGHRPNPKTAPPIGSQAYAGG